MKIFRRISIERSVPTALLMLGALLASSSASGSASVAKPSTSECLASSEASVQLAKKHALKEERSQLLICSAASCPGDIRRECTRRVDDVNAAIPTVTFEVTDSTGQDLSDVKLSMDGAVLSERLDGTALSVDPGDHTFSFETAGQPAVEKHLVIREGQKDRREAITFPPVKAVSAPVVAPQPAANETPVSPPLGSDSEHALGAQKTFALVAGGVGIAGVVVGSIFGLKSKSKHDEAAAHCSGSTCVDSQGLSANQDAVKAGNISTVGFVVGAVGLVGGAVLWFTAKSAAGEGTAVGLAPGSIQLRGVW